MTGFICHDDYYDRLVRLSDEEVGHLFRALMLYHSGRELPDFIGAEGIAFDFIRDDIDRMEEKCETNRRNRKSSKDDEAERIVTNANEQERNAIYKDKDKDKDKEKENKKREGVRFTPPSVEEVRAYCQQRNNGIDAEAFVAFYASKGWKVGNSPMKDWKQCVITWEKRDRATTKPAKTVIAQQYEQRDYSGVQEEILERQRKEIMERLRAKHEQVQE